ncbi:MAG: glycerate kinase [Coprobacillus sp.]
MKIIIASDSFKGSLSSYEVANHIKMGASKVFPHCEFEVINMADGGEGTVEAMISSIGGHIETVVVKNPLHQDINASYGVLDNNSAIIEMAAASGLPLVENNKDIYNSSTYGTGQLIKEALDYGCKTIYIGIGGSATNDGGIGMANALGIRFLDKDKNELPCIAYSLPFIEYIDMSHLDKRIQDTKIVVMCDVDNPLCGINGASAVYGPQKGATPNNITYLDNGLEKLANVCISCGLKDNKDIQGAGAAGGLGFGLMTFLNAKLLPGIDVVLEANHFIDKLDDVDLVITGEGKIDYQSIHGKVPTGVAKIAKKKEKPVIAIVGCIGENASLVYDYGVDSIESCVYKPCTLEEALSDAGDNVEKATERILRSIQIGMSI